MTTRWLAVLGCALISLPFMPAATAQTQPAASSSAAPVKFELASTVSGNFYVPAGPLNREMDLNTKVTSISTATLSASASESGTFLLGAPGLWTAQDAIPLVSSDKIDSGSETSQAGPDTSNCRWALGISNAWNCKIKPLTRHEFPIHDVLHHLWPLHSAIN